MWACIVGWKWNTAIVQYAGYTVQLHRPISFDKLIFKQVMNPFFNNEKYRLPSPEFYESPVALKIEWKKQLKKI